VIDRAAQFAAKEKFGFDAFVEGALDAGNIALNAIVDIPTTAVKTLGAASGLAPKGMIPGLDAFNSGGVGAGWKAGADLVKKASGSDNPGWADWALRGYSAVTGDPVSLPAGKSARDVLDDQFKASLRGSRVWSETLGTVAAMVSSPGMAVQKAGASLAAPMAAWAERAIVTGVAKKYLAKEAAEEALSTGRVWEEIAKLPEWKKGVDALDKLYLAAGRGVEQTIGMGAANIAQSYALSDDSDRIQAMKGAAFVSPFMAPIAGLGTMVGRAVANSRMVPAEYKAALLRDLSETAGGSMSLPTFSQRLRGAGAVGLANTVAASTEGLLFAASSDWDGFWADYNASFGKDADPEAMGRLMARIAGATAGSLVGRFQIPADQLPYWKRIRPDLDRFRLAVEAEELAKLPEPEIALEDMPLAEPGAVKRPKFKIDEDGVETYPGRVLNPRQQAQGQDPIQSAAARVEALRPVARQASPLMDSGWTLRGKIADEGDVAVLELGPDSVTMSMDGTDSVSVRVPVEVYRSVAEWGDVPAGEPTGGTVKMSGQDAELFLNRLTQLSMARRAMMAIDSARLGYEDRGDNGWFDPNSGAHLRQALDGTLLRQDAGSGTWTKEPGVLLTQVPAEGPVFGSPSLDAMGDWVKAKTGMAPDRLGDSLLNAAVHYAAFYDTPRSRELRALVEGLWPDGQPSDTANALLRKDLDQVVGYMMTKVMAGETTAGLAMEQLDSVAASEAAKVGEPHPVVGRAMDALYPNEGPGFVGEIPRPAGEPVVGLREGQGQVTLRDLAMKAAGADEPVDFPGPKPKDWKKEPPGPETDVLSGQRAPVKTIATLLDLPNYGSGESPAMVSRAGIDRALGVDRDSGSRGILRDTAAKLFVPLPDALASRAKTPESQEAVRLSREQMSRARVIYAEVDTPMQAAEAAWKKVAQAKGTFGTGDSPKTWGTAKIRALVEGMVEPKNAAEAAAVKAVRDWNKANYETMVRAGTLIDEGGGRFSPMRSSDGAKLPRLAGDDFGSVFGSSKLRSQLGTEVYEHPRNAALKDRFTTREDFLTWWESLYNPKRKANAKDLERQANAEIHRVVEFMPDAWSAHEGGKRYKLFETNPYDLMRRATDKFSRRAATVEVFGQNLPKRVMEQFGRTKTGLDAQVDLMRAGVESGDESARWKDKVDAFAAYMQGGEGQKAGALTRFYRPFDTFIRGAMTWASFVRDIADPGAVLPSLVGHMNVLKALKQVATGSEGLTARDMFEAAKRDGAYIRDAGELAVGEGGSVMANINNMMTAGSRLSEKIKAVVAHRAARLVLEGYKDGTVVGGDAEILKGFGFSESESAVLMSGDAPASLQSRFTQEVVKMATGQYRPGEGSLAHSNPNFQAAFRFTKFTIGRLHALYKVYGANAKIAFDSSASMAARSAALARIVGVTFSVTVTAAMGEMFARLLRNPADGGRQFFAALASAPASYTANMVAGATFGTAGSQLQAVSSDPHDGGNFANLTAPTAVAYEALMAIQGQQSYSGLSSYQRAFHAMRRIGLVPFGSALEGIGSATGVMVDKRRDLAIRIGEFKRLHGIDTASAGGDKDKKDEFYIAMKQAKRAIGNHLGDDDAAWHAALGYLETAARAEGKSTVASSLSSSKLMSGLSPEQRLELREFLGSETEWNDILAQDALMDGMSRASRRTFPDPITGAPALPAKEGGDPILPRIEVASKLAREGDPRAFNDVFNEVVEMAKASYAAGEGIPDDIETLAFAMAQYPERVGDLFSPREAAVLRNLDETRASAFIRYTLARKVIESTMRERRESIKSAASR
jgi:hypothetical protein